MVCALALGSGCSDPAAERPRAVVIGVDGADWTIIDQLIAAGELPHFAGLLARGTRADLETLHDIPLSPVIWTSVATGKSAAQHGITWFLVDQPDGTRVPVRSTNRKVEALWNILDRAERSTAVIGWWATYPAEPLRHGLIASDALGFHGFGSTARDAGPEGKVSPADWFPRIDACLPVEQQVAFDFVRRFIDVDEDTWRRERYDPARNAVRQPFNALHLFQQYAVTAEGYTRIAEETLRDGEFDVALVYFEQVDSFSHLFMKYDPPRLPWVDDTGVARYSRVVREWYRYQDELLGRLLAHIDLETTAVFLVSDHGFKSGERRIRSERLVDVQKAHLDHETHGVFLAAGPGIQRGVRIPAASVLDVTPTLLHYLGLPVGKDMDGRVVEALFAAPRPIRYVATHETGERRSGSSLAAGDPAATAAAMEGLRALGYLGEGDGSAPLPSGAPKPAATAGESSPELHNNLGRVHLSRGEVERAEAEFQAALRLDPKNAEALLNLGALHRAAGRTELAQRSIERALQVDPNSAFALAELAQIRRDQGALADAIRLYQDAVALNDAQPGLFLGLGDVLQRSARYADAEAAFQRALELDPDSFAAQYNLGVTYDALGRRAEARERYERALALDNASTLAALVWNNLGALHSDEGRVDDALTAFERAAACHPGHLESRFNAAMIHLERGALEPALAHLEEASALAPSHELIHTRLGLVYLTLGRAPEADRTLRLVERLAPRNWAAKVGLAALRVAGERTDEARVLLADGLALGGAEARALAASLPGLAALLPQ